MCRNAKATVLCKRTRTQEVGTANLLRTMHTIAAVTFQLRLVMHRWKQKLEKWGRKKIGGGQKLFFKSFFSKEKSASSLLPHTVQAKTLSYSTEIMNYSLNYELLMLSFNKYKRSDLQDAAYACSSKHSTSGPRPNGFVLTPAALARRRGISTI